MLQLMHSFKGLMPPEEVLNGVRNGEISSFCLFAYTNVQSPAQVHDLTQALYQAAEEGNQPPPIIGIDQEGGQLIAITGGATELPGNMALGATRSPELAEQAGRVLGRELLAMGINMNFAPSVDVNTNPDNPVIGIRSFGQDPKLVSELGAALIKGMQSEGVIATAKHFPGHGDTAYDTHIQAPVVTHSLKRTHDIELMPFKYAIEAGTKGILTAHVMYEVLDKENPATLSHVILTELLRHELGFEGITVSDAMDMHAVSRLGDVTSVRAALSAGVDLVLLGHLDNQLSMHAETKDLANQSAINRIQAIRENLRTELPPLREVGSQEHSAIAQQIADQSITAVKSAQLPLSPQAGETIAVITPKTADLTPADTSSRVKIALADYIRERHPLVQHIMMDFKAPDIQIKRVLDMARHADHVIVGTIAADTDKSQGELVRALLKMGKNPIVVAMRTPYDLVAFPNIDTYLCTYSVRKVSMEAVTKVLFGEIPSVGQLPCEIVGIKA